MTRWVFSDDHTDDYIDPNPGAFKPGTYMYADNRWYKCIAGSRSNYWVYARIEEVPPEIRAKHLLVT